MPSRATQKLTVIRNKNSKNTGNILLIMAKTGYVDVTVNGQRFYYNAKSTNQPMTQRNIVQRVVNQNTTNQRRTITITRKGG